MNILYLHAHDLGRWIAPYGYAMPTPRLSAFARRSTLFRRAFCAAPTCSPSRAALLTGQAAHATGMLGLAHRGFRLAHPERHLARYLRGQGWSTWLFGEQHEVPAEEEHALYDYLFNARHEMGPKGYGVPESCREADMLNARKAAGLLRAGVPGDPFYMAVGLFHPHRPFPSSPTRFDPDYVQPPPPLPDTPAMRREVALCMEAIENCDMAMGLVLDALAEGPHARDTLVLLTTDHGPAFPLMKCNLTDPGIGVTLMIDYPGNPGRGTVTDSLVSHLDLFPTVCDLAGLPPPAWLEGHSLRPVLEGKADAVRSEIFAGVTFHSSYQPMRCVRGTRFKLVRHFGAKVKRPLPNIDPGDAKQEFVEAGFAAFPRDEVCLYDLLLDPGEGANLAGHPDYAAVRAGLEAKLDRWMRDTADPLLQGRVAPPAGALVTAEEAFATTDSPAAA